MSNQPASRNAWVQLYEARRVAPEPEKRPQGRPPAPIPRHKVGLTLSQGEVAELEVWQERLSELLGRKVSTGETVGILARLCSARLTKVSGKEPLATLDQLVERMVNGK